MPDTGQWLSPVNPLHYYYQEITTYVPVQATVNGLVVPLDSAKYETVTGLPPGLSVWPNIPPDRGWPSGANGCFVINGQVAFADSGTFNPQITFRVYALGTNTLLHFRYKMLVVDSTLTAITANPSSDKVWAVYGSDNKLYIHGKTDSKCHVYITDMLGRRVFSKSVIISGTQQEIAETNRFSEGLYLINIITADKTFTQKVFLH